MTRPENAADRREIIVQHDILELLPVLRRRAWRLTRQWDAADDLVQSTLLRAIENIEKFEPGTNLRAWLSIIMRNIFYNEIRLRRREAPGRADCVSVSSRASVAPSQEWVLRADEAMRAVGRLPEPFREMFRLVVIQGESYEASARICDCAMGTVKSRVNRARQMIMDEIADRSI
ncbi:sigma-70 family RNA polymerase sigma factor [Frigidibacter sp. MR17.24]|uniref:sigma-70 family RNA polymerase sigma factor n=1 Tax=Frigidibacter sp. MR17.24 TaxID=3127345 RepID=UPI0030129FF1